MLTAKGSVEDQIRGLEGGADDYVVKPFRFPVLLARVRALLRRGATAPIQCGPLVVDFGAKEVTVAGRPVYLSATERSLLEFLAMNVGRTVTKAEILERVWQDGDRATNVVEVYINYLRQKLERNLSHRLIYTVRGKGYRLNSKEIL
jgi:DNA-binding response OmpR family regulator